MQSSSTIFLAILQTRMSRSAGFLSSPLILPPAPNPLNDFRLESPIQPLSSDSHQHHPSTSH
ncbi:hypothetical protein E2C01_034279 [Portunus trituberculatus]|uniref:Uncharacterized protein n=1 Tax=Portunus trituberculatus TaxID=210409 RepID=A0A5B7F842_PORTR|nr:hypothetical protein [Portunus trituberculatus]